jgi:uncharacterized protein YkwD
MGAILFFIAPSFLLAQNNFDYSVYDTYTHKTYHQHTPFHEEIDFDHINYPLLHAAIFFATNKIRHHKRKSILEFHPKLEKSAQMHAQDMVTYKFFGHINKYNKDHETPKDRAKVAGIENPYIAENVAEEFGLQYTSGDDVYIIGPGEFSKSSGSKPIPSHTYFTLAEKVLEAWMNSPPHKKNILRNDVLQLGCGAWYYVNEQFNFMPTFLFTQNFQLYEKIK